MTSLTETDKLIYYLFKINNIAIMQRLYSVHEVKDLSCSGSTMWKRFMCERDDLCYLVWNNSYCVDDDHKLRYIMKDIPNYGINLDNELEKWKYVSDCNLLDIVLTEVLNGHLNISKLDRDTRSLVNLVKFAEDTLVLKCKIDPSEEPNCSVISKYEWDFYETHERRGSDVMITVEYRTELSYYFKYRNGLPHSIGLLDSSYSDGFKFGCYMWYDGDHNGVFERWIRSRPIDLYVKSRSSMDKCPYI